MSTANRCRPASRGSTRSASACLAKWTAASSASPEASPRATAKCQPNAACLRADMVARGGTRLLRDAVPRRDRVGHIRRPGQECIRADERLTHAAVDLDTESVDHDPGLVALELFLRHRDGVDEPWLETDGYAAADVIAEPWDEPLRQRRDDVGADDSDRRVEPHCAGQRHTVRRAHIDAAANLITHFEGALRAFIPLLGADQ